MSLDSTRQLVARSDDISSYGGRPVKRVARRGE